MGSMSLAAQSPPDSGKNHSRALAASAASAGNEIIGEILSWKSFFRFVSTMFQKIPHESLCVRQVCYGDVQTRTQQDRPL